MYVTIVHKMAAVAPDQILATIADEVDSIERNVALIREHSAGPHSEHNRDGIMNALVRIAHASDAAVRRVNSPVTVKLTFTWFMYYENSDEHGRTHQSSIILRRDGHTWTATQDRVFASEATKYGTNVRQHVFKWREHMYDHELSFDVGTVSITNDSIYDASAMLWGGGTVKHHKQVLIEYM